MMGTDVVVSPVFEPTSPGNGSGSGTTAVSMWLPEPESEWVAWDGSTTEAGGQTVSLQAGLDYVPAFVRAGQVLPLQSTESSMAGANATSPDVLLWTLWIGKRRRPVQSGFDLFEDDGITEAYKTVTDGAASNVSTTTQAASSVSQTQVTISIVGTSGTFPGAPTERQHWYAVRGYMQSTGKSPSKVTVSGKDVPKIDPSSSSDFGFFIVDSVLGKNALLSNPEGTLIVRAGGAVSVAEL